MAAKAAASPSTATRSALAAGTVVPATCGVFVDAASTAVAESGTQAAPYKSLAAALAAVLPNQPIYVCTSPLDEAALLEADTRLYGGLDCATWATGVAAARTAWTAPANEIPLAVRGAGVSATVAGFAITARSATGQEPSGQGRSSIAAWVDAASVTLERVELVAAEGAAGAAGAAPPAAAAQAPNGSPGQNGCVDTTAKAGGNPGQNTCEDALGNMVNVNGGLGGTGTSLTEGGNGSSGQPIGQGGAGGKAQDATGCDAGAKGTDRTPAPPATLPASHPGALDATGYHGPEPVDGPRGVPGTGGGGGGGARACSGGNAGPGGGGDGAGGCGGLGGKGGAPAARASRSSRSKVPRSRSATCVSRPPRVAKAAKARRGRMGKRQAAAAESPVLRGLEAAERPHALAGKAAEAATVALAPVAQAAPRRSSHSTPPPQ
jgi:hypothetical protein